MSGADRLTCLLYTILLINLILEVNGQEDRKGPVGSRGDAGAKGERGERGEKGDVGSYGKITDDTVDEAGFGEELRETPIRGGEANSATSCQDDTLDTSKFESDQPTVYIYDAKPFQVTCVPSADTSDSDTENKDAKTYLLKEKTKEVEHKPYKFPAAESPFWLSTVGFDLLGFYKNFQIGHISQLKYLLKISYKASLEIVVHCKNTVISNDPEKYLQIHLWDGQNVGPSPTLKSPANYEIPDELNKCKDFSEEKKWGTATIRLTTSSNFIKDFYVRDIQKGTDQEIYIELKEFWII